VWRVGAKKDDGSCCEVNELPDCEVAEKEKGDTATSRAYIQTPTQSLGRTFGPMNNPIGIPHSLFVQTASQRVGVV